MISVGRFEKVTLNEYKKARRKMDPSITDGRIRQEYDSIVIPTRATAGSAGYDIAVPYDVYPGMMVKGQIKLPTGLRFVPYPVTDSMGNLRLFVLKLFVRSSTGTKKGWVLSNSTGIVDSDYADADNEGHIYICLTPNGLEEHKSFEVNEPICQGIFEEVFCVDEFVVTASRVGGFGSTSCR